MNNRTQVNILYHKFPIKFFDFRWNKAHTQINIQENFQNSFGLQQLQLTIKQFLKIQLEKDEIAFFDKDYKTFDEGYSERYFCVTRLKFNAFY